jgi:hypothetical protein
MTWLQHAHLTEDHGNAKQTLKHKPAATRPFGYPLKRQLNDVKTDAETGQVSDWLVTLLVRISSLSGLGASVSVRRL